MGKRSVFRSVIDGLERVADAIEAAFKALFMTLGCGLAALMLIAVLGAYVQAILTCAKEGRGFTLVLGALVPPVGVVNGFLIWLGWW